MALGWPQAAARDAPVNGWTAIPLRAPRGRAEIRISDRAGHEWSMVVEDDFVVCGPWSMEGIARVSLELGSTLVVSDGGNRPSGIGIIDDARGAGEKRPARWRGAFVGTGGKYELQSCISKRFLTVSYAHSGLILHHTLLPTLIQLLELVHSLAEPSAPHPWTPPDMLVQQCLSGEIALCNTITNPAPSSSDPLSPAEEFERSPYPALPPTVPISDLPPLLTPSAPATFLMSSRLLMAHTGHALSTGNRSYHEGKWGCGCRQPMLGNRGVGVVVVQFIRLWNSVSITWATVCIINR